MHCGADDDETLQQPILRAICDSSMRVSLAIAGIANFSPLCAFVTVESLTVGKLSVSNQMGAVNRIGPEGGITGAGPREDDAAHLARPRRRADSLLGEASGGLGGRVFGVCCWVRAWMRCGVVGVRACGRAMRATVCEVCAEGAGGDGCREWSRA